MRKMAKKMESSPIIHVYAGEEIEKRYWSIAFFVVFFDIFLGTDGPS